MSVTSQHPEYTCNVEDWCIIDNVLKGKAKQYIPDIEPLYPRNHSLYDANRQYIATRSCKNYREGARFSNFSKQTLDAIVGLATNCPPEAFELPPELEYIRDVATGDGLTFDQLHADLIRGAVGAGRICLLTDFPTVQEGLDAEKQAEINPLPRMYVFPATSVINWDTSSPNGIGILTQVVIHKSIRVKNPMDRFTWKLESRYLVLEIDADGYYTQTEYDKGDNVIVPTFKPKANGQWLKKIPFSFIGSENNNPKVDSAPLKSIVELNIGHLRNSAIYEDNLKKYGRGTLNITSSLPTEDWKEFYASRPIILGTEEGYYLGESGEFKIAQLAPAQEAAIAMTQKQDQMVMLGAHIVVANPANIAENTVRLNMGNKISMLSCIVGNVEDALEEHLGYCADYLGANRNLIDLQFSTEFIEKVADSTVMQQLFAQVIAGKLPVAVLWSYLRDVKLLSEEVTDEELKAALAKEAHENPLEPVQNDNTLVDEKPTNNGY